MDILELLMKNWWVLLALLWFFSGALGKKGKQRQAEQQREQQSRPQHLESPNNESELLGQQASIEFPWEKVGRESRQEEPITRQVPREFMEMSTRKVDDHLNTNQLARTEIDTLEEIGQDNRVISTGHVNYSKHAKQLLDFKSVDKAKVVQGMVWSQIFGKPRAKEPHSASIYSRSGRRQVK